MAAGCSAPPKVEEGILEGGDFSEGKSVHIFCLNKLGTDDYEGTKITCKGGEWNKTPVCKGT